jgi:hypothetical protein
MQELKVLQLESDIISTLMVGVLDFIFHADG